MASSEAFASMGGMRTTKPQNSSVIPSSRTMPSLMPTRIIGGMMAKRPRTRLRRKKGERDSSGTTQRTKKIGIFCPAFTPTSSPCIHQKSRQQPKRRPQAYPLRTRCVLTGLSPRRVRLEYGTATKTSGLSGTRV